jgi:hypothetical protein
MTRPAIVIGLGGTGQWVLTFLKKELLEIGGGTLPQGVKLLAFDTASRMQVDTAVVSTDRTNEQRIVRLGNVSLEDGTEYFSIGDNLYDLAQQIKNGQHPHLQWFPAATLLDKLPKGGFITTIGAGGVRQLGRLSLFNKAYPVLAKLEAAITALQDDVTGTKTGGDMRILEVLIVGSLAGGTGAGTLVDMAWLIRTQADRLLGDKYIVRAFLVLPGAFTTGGAGQGRDKMARAFAAWGEIDRFMLSNVGGNHSLVVYNPSDSDLKIKCDKPVYDVTYILEPQRKAHPLPLPAEESLFPAVSHCMSLILDEKAGMKYTEHITANIATERAGLPTGVYHSSIGAYTLKVPVYYAHAKFSHQLALDAMRELLAPEINDKGRVTRVSELRNREASEGAAGRRSALNFMAASGMNVSGQEIPGTLFLPLVSEIREKEGQRGEDIIRSVANGGLTNAKSKYLLALTDISQDQTGKLIARDIADEILFPIWKDVAPSRVAGDTPAQAVTRIKNRLPDVRHEHYGIDTVEGIRSRGKYGIALEKAQAAQIARFSKLLRGWTSQTLNGNSTDPVIARGGKIGYVRAFYDELIETLSYFIGFIDKVSLYRRETLKLAGRTKEAAKSAFQQYESEATKQCWLTFWDDNTHPDAHRAQRRYLQAEQRAIDVRKDDILLDVLSETAQAMKVIAGKTLADIDDWIAHLATGDPALNIASLYMTTNDSLDGVKSNHELDKRLGNIEFDKTKTLKKVSQVIGEDEYKADKQHIADALSALEWQVDDNLGISLVAKFPQEDKSAPPLIASFRRDGENPAQQNLAIILRLGERPYYTLKKDRPLAREIAQVYPTGKQLATALSKQAEPFFTPSAVSVKPRVISGYIRCHTDTAEQLTYFKEQFLPEFRQLNAEVKLELVDSQDSHKLTVLRADDLMPSTNFAAWHECQKTYLDTINDPYHGIPGEELYTFPAEVNAAHYESVAPKLLRRDFRKLHPEVVALLDNRQDIVSMQENRERFTLFFLSYAHGFLKVSSNTEGQPFWEYQLPLDKESLYITVPETVIVTDKVIKGRQTILSAVRNFLDGYDRRQGFGEALKLDWVELKRTIVQQEIKLGQSDTVKLYRRQIDRPDGLVERILNQIKDLPEEKNENLARAQRQRFEDLADVVKVVYLETIQRVEQRK